MQSDNLIGGAEIRKVTETGNVMGTAFLQTKGALTPIKVYISSWTKLHRA